jgi:Nucleotidyl transferase AbiEii toxin, Type IV TA system
MTHPGLEAGFALDRLFRWMEGAMEGSKRPTLIGLARILAESGVHYALIGGVALQIHRREPRTTLDIDLVLASREQWPDRELEREGFRKIGSFEHSENWAGPDGTPVQITTDAMLADGIVRAVTVDLDGVPLRVLAPADLLRAKLRAAADPARRRSKRLLDLADAQGLIEDHPELGRDLDSSQRRLLERLDP